MTEPQPLPYVTVVIPYDRHRPNLAALCGRLALEPDLDTIVLIDYRDQPEPAHLQATAALNEWTERLAPDRFLVARQPRATLADCWNLAAELARLHADETERDGVLVIIDAEAIVAPLAVTDILVGEADDAGVIAWLHDCGDIPVATMTADGFDGRAFALPADGVPLCSGTTDGLTLDDCARDLLATLDKNLNLLHVGGLIA